MTVETEAQKRTRLQIYESFKDSGESIKGFARNNGFTVWKVQTAIRKTESETGTGKFQELSFSGISESSYEVELANGRVLRIKGIFSTKRVEQLIKVLEEC
jgi:hypothetical protein